MSKMKSILGKYAMMAIIAENSYQLNSDKIIIKKNNIVKGQIPQKRQFNYWFRADGTFSNEKQRKIITNDECIFKCFSINDKNAIRKFNSFMSSKKKY